MSALSVETKIWQALRTRVATLQGGYTISWPMEPFSPPTAGGKPAPYVECRNIQNRTSRVFIGSSEPHDRKGILQLSLCWPVSEVGTGSGKTHPDVLTERAGQIAAHFPTDHRMTFGDVDVRVTSAPDVAQGYLDGTYIKVPVSINWRTFT